ncbi:MAG: starch-binding protein [Prevotella buccae]|uniref:starch-binding protein n=1 Tax=Segatella buccae TaxID=28126 RepID=UPI00030A41CB|nr:starch-binding protein [Segatella buccae]MBS5896040.1 starch-binding protein [Segatella buccae]
MNKTTLQQAKHYAMMLFMVLVSLQSALAGNGYGLPKTIQEGVILHCFDWKYTDITANLPNIAAAGFTAVQTSPAQTNYDGPTSWNTLYRPRDTEIGPNTLGTKADLATLCAEAHKLGIKVIVDVVANHTDGVLKWVANFWQNTDLYHTHGGNINWGDRWQVTHGEIGMKDLKTEDPRVQQKFKAYIQALKAIGVDGCRFDAAKHIGLPSEGDGFWPAIIDKDMFNYGEILENTGGDDSKLLPEYMQYMSVTDSRYGTDNVLGAAKNGQATLYGGGNYSFTYSTDKLIYWGESHDTYCNKKGHSVGVSQEVVDRAYAVAASHNNIPALYFSRPVGTDGLGAQAGAMGSTHYTSKSVAEVNKFHNAMAGKGDYYTAAGSVASISRKDGGAIVVNFQGAGSVSVANGGGYATPGTYTDRVSGNTFTITATTISGTTDASGIAVLYEEANPSPTVVLSQKGGPFKAESLDLTATLRHATAGWYQVGTAEKVNFTGNATFTIGAGVDYGKTITVKWGATGTDGTEATGSETFTKTDPNAKVYVYYNNPYNWANVNCYLYKNKVNNSWPGKAMTYDAAISINGKTGWWYFEVPETYATGHVMVTDGKASGTRQYPGAGQPGIRLNGNSLYIDGETTGETTVTPGNQPTPPTPDDPTTGITIYVKADNAPYLYAWDNDKNKLNGQWPGKLMTAQTTINGISFYYQSFNENPINIIFNDNNNHQTANIMGVTSTSYFSYDGTTGYEKIEPPVKPDGVEITLSGEYTSFASSENLNFKDVDGLKAYIVSGYKKSKGNLTIVLLKADYVPAGTGLILKGTANTTYTVGKMEMEAGYHNFLKGVTAPTTISTTEGDNTNYVFVKDNGRYAFAKVASTRSLPAGKAYLRLPTSVSATAGAKAIGFVIEGETTGINEVAPTTPASDEDYYTLSGIKTRKPTRGIYIHQGRKVVVI